MPQAHCDPTDPREIWCANLTVSEWTHISQTRLGYHRAQNEGTLEPDTFTWRTATIEFSYIFRIAGSSQLSINFARNAGTTPSDGLLGPGQFTLVFGTGPTSQSIVIDNPGTTTFFGNSVPGMPAWSENDVVPIRLLGPTPTPHNVQVDAPEGTAGYLHVEWEAQPDSGTAAYHVRARPTVDTDTAEYRGKYFTGGRFRRVATDVRDYTFYGIVPGITYRSQVCRVTALHAAYAGFDTIGDCSPWQSIRLPAAGDADANDVKVSLEFPDGSATTTLTPDTHGTLHYRVRLSGINDLSQYRSPRWGAGSWALFLKPNESRKTHRLGPGYGQVPEYFGHVHRGANLSHLTWDKPTSGYIDQSFTLTSTMRGRGPLIVELFDHRTDHSNTDLGSQRKLCVDFEDAMGDIAAPCPSGSQQAPEPAAPATGRGARRC